MRFFTLLLSVILMSCKSSYQFRESDTICNYNNNIFSKLQNNLDLNLYKEKLDIEDVILSDNDLFISELYKTSSRYVYSTTDKLNNIIRISMYDFEANKLKSYFMYKNGAFKIYKSKIFDEEGNIVKIIDHEKGYDICWKEAITIIKKVARKEIKKYEVTTFNLQRIDINEFPKEKPLWSVSLNGNEAYQSKEFNDGYIFYEIDGVTGKFLGKRILKQISHEDD